MGGLRGVTILLAISLGQALALGAPPEPAAAPEPVKTQEKPSALEFIKAGAYLYNKGQVDKASSYFKAADRFRDQLTENEEVVLEVYLEEVENYYKKRTATAVAPVQPPVDAAVAPASTTATALPHLVETARSAVPMASQGRASMMPDLQGVRQPSRFDSIDPKQKARWLLQEAREQMAQGHYTEAARKIAEAKAMNVKWGFLDESPDKASKLLQKVMAKSPNGPSTPSARPLGVRVPDSTSPQPAGTGIAPAGTPNRKL
ncbi:hypothetical protein SAMN05444166_0459 [Singulisphaera sp. GP187]|uniref:hypothetical protein n=1 Tax=Singulisphaera sp. GP187 TaxID=1882752 RepID=UPI00092AAC3D|nr:hypothetical protein [Singulisphaera sp. GP187]SIN72594.1 hypothetical protein SAMN05444166_0459 [Singulisphaera sp. GP187]